MLGTAGNVNVEAEQEFEAEETGPFPSLGIGTPGSGTGTTTAVITRLEMATGNEPMEDSELRRSPPRICEWRNRSCNERKA